ncbi:MAG: lipid II flippase MurJ [Candidatus Micrarchaeia archaeon]
MSLKKASLILTGITAVGMIFGMGKQIVIAKYFGTSAELDSFLIACAIPSVIGGISIGFFSSIIIPILTPLKEKPGEMAEAITPIIFFAFLLAIGTAIFGFAFKEFLLKLLTTYEGERLSYIAHLAGYVWIITGINIFTYFLSALFNLYKRFILPALVNLLIPIGIILATIFLSNKINIESITIGWLIASIIGLLLMFPIVFKIGVGFNRIKDSIVYNKAVFFNSIPVLIGGMPFTILPTIDSFWTSKLPTGSMSYIGYCTSITIAIDTLVKNGVYTAILPYLSENFSSGDDNIFWHRTTLALKYIYAILIPVVIFFIYFRQDLIQLLFERGRFSKQSTENVYSLLPYYLIGGLLAMVPVTILNRAYYARQQFLSFASIGIVMIIFYFIFSGLLSHRFGVYGIGMAYVAYWFIFLIVLTMYIKAPWINKQMLTLLFKLTLISVASVGIIHYAFQGSYFILKGITGMTIFMLLAHLMKVHRDIELEGLVKEIMSKV